MTTIFLKQLIARLQRETFDNISNWQLLSITQIYIAIYNMVSFNSLDEEYGDRRTYSKTIDTLFNKLQRGCRTEPDIYIRSRMINAMYSLLYEVYAVIDSKKKEICGREVVGLVECVDAVSPMVVGNICRCMANYLYPYPKFHEKLYCRFNEFLHRWCDELDADGGWHDIDTSTALERIMVLNMNSFMFLDSAYNDRISRSMTYYRGLLLPIPRTLGNFDETHIYTLGRFYDAMLLGNAYDIDYETAADIVAFMYNYRQSAFSSDIGRLYCDAYIVHYLTHAITRQIHDGLAGHIA